MGSLSFSTIFFYFLVIYTLFVKCEPISRNYSIPIKPGEGSVCYSDSNCHTYDPNLVCVNNRCHCSANYLWDSFYAKCNSFVCDAVGDYRCTIFDPNRYCSINGQCLCKHDYQPDYSNGEACKLVKYDTCTGDSSCDDTNEVCVDDQCRCAPDYHFNERTQKCEYKSCDSINDCSNTWDNMRVCHLGYCVCYDSDYKEDYSNGRKCVYDYSLTWSWAWMWTLIVFPILLFASIIALIVRCRRRSHYSGHTYH